MAYWLKSVYNTDRRTSAVDWRDQLTWLSDGHRFSGDRPTYRPKYVVGDELVVYAVTDGVCPVRAEVIAEPVFDPERVSRESGSDEGERWGWLTEIRVLAAADLDRAPSLFEVGVAPLSVRQSDHIHLTDEQYELARRELPAGSRGRRRSARPVPVEERHAESFEQRFEQRLRSVQREEQRMVRTYKSFLERRGRHVSRYLIALPDGSGPLYTDLYEHDRGNLIEAKARIDRPAIRMAIGQLADYARHIDPAESEGGPFAGAPLRGPGEPPHVAADQPRMARRAWLLRQTPRQPHLTTVRRVVPAPVLARHRTRITSNRARREPLWTSPRRDVHGSSDRLRSTGASRGALARSQTSCSTHQ